MLINQLVTGLTFATQAQCMGIEYVRGGRDQALVDFCSDSGYYVGHHLQFQQWNQTPASTFSMWGFFSEYIQQCIFMFDSLPPIWQSLFSEAEMNQMQKEYESLQKLMDEEDCPF